jgi:phosphoribosylaminoimidazole-succinocarboxamide synthase
MVRGRCTFRQGDLTRALRAAKAAGVPVKIEFQDGKMTVTSMDKAGTVDSERNEWDAEYGPDQAKVRKRLRKP